LFYATNAQDQVVVVTEDNEMKQLCEKLGVRTMNSFEQDNLKPGDNYKRISEGMNDFPMVGQFLTTLFPVGHFKSTTPNDELFLSRVTSLEKWLRMS
jgi:hypothetical protein